MDWLQVLGVLIGNAAIVVPLWLHLDAKMHAQSLRSEDTMRILWERWERETADFKEKWVEEVKDFHARLYNLEERYKMKHEKTHHS